jgi:asparagine synthase (glutamine-hydrolysing)
MTREILFGAWSHWPEEWTTRLDGLYALAFWTLDGSDLSLCRDMSGQLGLFHARTQNGCIAFASHLELLMRVPGVSRRISPQSLHEYLFLLDIAAPNTIFEGVRAVAPGERIVLDRTGVRADKPAPLPALPPIDVSFETALDTLEHRLSASIDARLEGVARPAAFLSGGIDSSLICALAAPKHAKLEAITVGFDTPGFDEAPVAQQIADHLGLRQRVLRFDRDQILHAMREIGQRAEQPFADPTGPVTLLAFERAQRDYDAILDGTGADEQMGAMPPRHVRIAVEYAARVPAGMRRMVLAALRRMPHMAGYAPIFNFDHPVELMRRWKGFAIREIEDLCGKPAELQTARFFQVFSRFPRHAHFERYSALIGVMPSDRLSQAALMTGLDVRFPFCSPGVDRHLRSLPKSYRWQADESKRILRALLARHVPRPLWDVPKHGFNFPLEGFLSHGNHELIRHYLLNGNWERWQLLRPDRVAEYAQRYISGERQLSFRVWALIVLATWLQDRLD